MDSERITIQQWIERGTPGVLSIRTNRGIGRNRYVLLRQIKAYSGGFEKILVKEDEPLLPPYRTFGRTVEELVSSEPFTLAKVGILSYSGPVPVPVPVPVPDDEVV